MDVEITHDTAKQRFEAVVDGVRCDLSYTLRSDLITITHTGVPTAVAGRGIAAALVKAAFDWARSEGRKVVPACSYAAVWVQRHPAYADMAV